MAVVLDAVETPNTDALSYEGGRRVVPEPRLPS
jgi:hypothetical protein